MFINDGIKFQGSIFKVWIKVVNNSLPTYTKCLLSSNISMISPYLMDEKVLSILNFTFKEFL